MDGGAELASRGSSSQMAHLLARKRDEVVPLAVQLRMTQQHLLQSREQQLRALEAQMAALDPRSKLRPGFVQLVKEDRAITLEKLKPKDRVRLEDGRYVAEATIDSVRPVS